MAIRVPTWALPLIKNEVVHLPINVTGALSTGTKASFVPGRPCRITKVTTGLGTVGTVQTTLVDVNKNGTTIFTTQGSRPSIAISAANSTGGVPDAGATNVFDADDIVTVDVDQFGTSAANLTVLLHVVYTG
jgi:hypothetical protein